MITTLTGKNSFALREKLRSIKSDTLKELGDMGLEYINAQDLAADDILRAVQSLPFLVSRKVVIVDEVQASAEVMDRLEELIDRTADEVDVVLVGPVFDKRKNAYKILKKRTTIIDMTLVDSHELPIWIIERVDSYGGTISRSDAQYLIDRVGQNQMILDSEIKKLSTFSEKISRQSIDALTEPSPQSSVFELLDAAFSGNKKKAIELYREQRGQKVEPYYIVAMLTWQLHGLAQAVFATPQVEATLVSAGVSPFSAKKSLTLAKSIDRAQLRKMVQDLSDLDASIKSTSEPDSALELFLLNL